MIARSDLQGRSVPGRSLAAGASDRLRGASHRPPLTDPQRLPAPQRSRHAGIDAARFIAFVAVLLIHTANQFHFGGAAGQGVESATSLFVGSLIDQLARFAVPFFFVTSGFFLARRDLSDRFRAVRDIAARLTPIYVVWVLIYNCIDPSARSHMLQWSFLPRLVLQGGVAPHLWFLPSLFICMAVIIVTHDIVTRPVLLTAAAVLYAIGLAVGSYSVPVFGHPAAPWIAHLGRDSGCFGLIFVLFGFWLGRRGWRPGIPAAIALVVTGAIAQLLETHFLFAAGSVPLGSGDFQLGTVPFGIGAFLLALTWPATGPVGQRLSKLGTYALGLYAIHPLFIQAIAAEWPPHDLPMRIVLAAAVATCSVLSTLMVARWPPSRRFLT